MKRRLPFVKMHGAANDFLMVDGAALAASGVSLGGDRIAALCDRRRAVGGDGLIVVAPDDGADFAMTYYNSDGGEAEMCGNGARCAFAFARELGLIDAAGTCRTRTGAIAGRCEDDGSVSVELTRPRGIELDAAASIGHPFARLHRADTGVPHLVIAVDDVDAVDLERWGPSLRRDPAFAPAGVNVDWTSPGPAGAWRMRTYERGVEAETLACGTGAAATALILVELGLAAPPVAILTRGGDRLTIGFRETAEGPLPTLRGPVVVAFRGEVEIDG